MLKLFQDVLPLIGPGERRQWAFLLAVSLASGFARSLFLAMINAAIAIGSDNEHFLFYALAPLLLIAIIAAADFMVSLRSEFMRCSMATRMRNTMLDQLS